MPVLEVPAEQAREMVWGDSEEGELVEERITGTSRWSVNHESIIKYQEKYWKVRYSTAATEQQDERPFEDVQFAKFVEVERVPVTKYVWKEL
jgi:hypothetical protein